MFKRMGVRGEERKIFWGKEVNKMWDELFLWVLKVY